MNPYDDLLGCPRPRTERRLPMPMEKRAVQFAPFAALTGYDDAVQETERQTDRRPELAEDRAEALDHRLRWLREHLDEAPEITVTWFIPDARKAGGACRTRSCRVKRLDARRGLLLLPDEECVPIAELLDLQIPQPDE